MNHPVSNERTNVSELAKNTDEAKAAAVNSAAMSEAELAEAKHYGRLALYCDLADKVLDLLVLGVLALVFAVPLDRWLSQWIESATLRLLALLLVVTGVHLCVSFPLSFYAGHVLGASLQAQPSNAGALAGAVSEAQPAQPGVWNGDDRHVVLDHLADRPLVVDRGGGRILPDQRHARAVDAGADPAVVLQDRANSTTPNWPSGCRGLAEGTGLSIQGVYRMGLSAETAKANAMLAGLGRTRRVLMGDTLARRIHGRRDRSDLRPRDRPPRVSPHSQDDRHRRGLQRAGILDLQRGAIGWAQRQYGPVDIHHLPPSTLPLLMLVLTVFGLVLEPLQNVISRRYERQMRPLRAGADRAARGVHLGLLQAGQDQQGRSQPAPAGGVSVSQPPADQRAAGDGEELAHDANE